MHDAGIREAAALSADFAYGFACMTLCWGVLSATGWIQRSTGRQTLRTGHMTLTTFTLAFGLMHAMSFLLLRDVDFSAVMLVLPFGQTGSFDRALGVIGLDVTIAVAATAGLRGRLVYWHWLGIHRFGYVAVTIAVVHSWLGAKANGDTTFVWSVGIAAFVPAATLTVLRLLPARFLVRAGLVAAEPIALLPADRSAKVKISVDNQRCHGYGICQLEAPEVFQLAADGRLQYQRTPDSEHHESVRAAERMCPMRAIQLRSSR